MDEIQHGDGCVYLGGMVAEEGCSEVEMRRWIQVGATAWRKRV